MEAEVEAEVVCGRRRRGTEACYQVSRHVVGVTGGLGISPADQLPS